jgi:hypothetical protein
MIPESWSCVDCGVNTAPGIPSKAKVYAGAEVTVDDRSEVYTVRRRVWKATGMKDDGGCLCIGCLEETIARPLTPEDFLPDNGLNMTPCTPRLMQRRMGIAAE